jgi:hypothetical protein
MNATDAKLEPYNSMRFEAVLVCLKTLDGAGCRAMTGLSSLGTPKLVGPPYASLKAVFGADKSIGVATPVRDAQLDLWVANAKLQPECNRIGLRRGGGAAAVRFGIVMDTQNNCSSTQSWVGFGGTPANNGCSSLPTSTKLPSIGAAHGCYGGQDQGADPAGVVSTFGWVFVR